MNALGGLTKEVKILVLAFDFSLFVFTQQPDGSPQTDRDV